MKKWQTLKKVVAYDHSKFLLVENHHVALPDGRMIENWPVVITPDYVNILARDGEGRYLFFEQNKYMAPAMTISPPGGYVDKGEEPLVAAQRELLEETGYAGGQWFHLGRYVVDSNRGCGNADLFLALNVSFHQPPQSDDLEEQKLVRLTRREVEHALEVNACPILSAAALIALGLRVVDAQPPTPSTK